MAAQNAVLLDDGRTERQAAEVIVIPDDDDDCPYAAGSEGGEGDRSKGRACR